MMGNSGPEVRPDHANCPFENILTERQLIWAVGFQRCAPRYQFTAGDSFAAWRMMAGSPGHES
jgi:hypothetical protein